MQSASGHIMHLFLSIFAIICNLLEKTGACNGNLAYKDYCKNQWTKIYTKNVRDNIPIQILKQIREEIENE